MGKEVFRVLYAPPGKVWCWKEATPELRVAQYAITLRDGNMYDPEETGTNFAYITPAVTVRGVSREDWERVKLEVRRY